MSKRLTIGDIASLSYDLTRLADFFDFPFTNWVIECNPLDKDQDKEALHNGHYEAFKAKLREIAQDDGKANTFYRLVYRLEELHKKFDSAELEMGLR